MLTDSSGAVPTALTMDPISRRTLLLAPIIAALQEAQASKLDPSQTIITLPSAIRWTEWTGLPPRSGETAMLMAAWTSRDYTSS
jgi:hypothetical protein